MQEDKADESILTLAEAAQFIRVSERTLGDLARRRRVPCQKVGREWRFSRTALEAWIAGRDETATAPASREPSPRPYELPTPEAATIAEPLVQTYLPFAGFRDTAFTENRDRTLHRWVPWIAGYSAAFVGDVLDKVGGGRDRLMVLDPFSGVGTTLIEALKHGHDAVGFEINPYAALACRMKVNAAQFDSALIASAIERFIRFMSDSSRIPVSRPPSGFASRVVFFSPDVEGQVLQCLDFINNETTDWLRDLFWVAFGSVMVSFSNYSYEPSLGTREAAGKQNILHADVTSIIKGKLREMLEDIEIFRGWLSSLPRAPHASVFNDSFFDGASKVPPASIDVLITSPPYLNNYHYIRNTRPHLFWLGMAESPKDLKDMETRSFGQFWQTVRAGPEVALVPDLPELKAQIEELKTRNPEKGVYGGKGWANYAASYFNDCARFCAITRRLMAPGGTMVVVIGNNILQGLEFPTDRYFAEIAKREGFELVEMHEVRKKRTGNSIVNSSVRAGMVKQRTILYETAVELRLPIEH